MCAIGVFKYLTLSPCCVYNGERILFLLEPNQYFIWAVFKKEIATAFRVLSHRVYGLLDNWKILPQINSLR